MNNYIEMFAVIAVLWFAVVQFFETGFLFCKLT